MKNDEVSIKRKASSAIYSFLQSGSENHNSIALYINENYNLSKDWILKEINNQKSILLREADVDVENVIVLHDHRYELIWKRYKDRYLDFIHTPSERGDYLHNALIVDNYKMVIKALKQREKIIGLRNNDLKINVSSSYNQDKKKDEKKDYSKINFDKLEEDELTRLVSILESSLNTNKKEQDFIVETAVVIEKEEDKKDNRKSKTIERDKLLLEIISKPPKPSNKITSSIKVIDITPENKGKTKEDINDVFKKALTKMIEEKYKNNES